MKSCNLVPVLLSLIIFSGCRSGIKQTGSEPSPIAVVIEPALKVDAGRDITLSGNIEGTKTVRLGFLVAGKIDFIAAEEGEKFSGIRSLQALSPPAMQ